MFSTIVLMLWLQNYIKFINHVEPTEMIYQLFITFAVFYRSRGEGWKINIVTTSDFSLDKRFYYTEETRTVKHNEETIFSRVYKNKFDRNPLTKIC